MGSKTERTEVFPGMITIEFTTPSPPMNKEEIQQFRRIETLRILKLNGLKEALRYAGRFFSDGEEVVEQMIEEHIIEKGLWLLARDDGSGLAQAQLAPKEKEYAKVFTEYQIFLVELAARESESELSELGERRDELVNKLKRIKKDLKTHPGNPGIIEMALNDLYWSPPSKRILF